ncbi:MAG: hypothetical protein DRJ66_06800 [Thermoprotei archaeon]|nr:MAG: hypothetical protein DRJ66_06800 [Thermoprotei archaeon]RLF19557.1 MAG: hypothetical protein DRZ82_05335 [Thermoprotei archaeon]
MSESVRPIHAQEYFTVSTDGEVTQIITFYYHDPEGYYRELAEEGRIGKELDKMVINMQSFLDEERIYINERRVRPEVVGADLSFLGSPEIVSAIFIIKFKGTIQKGINVYEDHYEPEITEYGYEIYWVFPLGWKILDVEMAGDHEIIGDGNILVVWAEEGTNTGGHERIMFYVP